MFGRDKKINHIWEYLPHFEVIDGMVVCVQVCKKTGACRYIRVPSTKKLEQMEGSKDS